MTRRTNRRRRQAGFTILEMMVALTAGAIAISSIYYVSAASSQHFHEQQRVAQSQMSLRMAVEQLRRDISRAGFMATPNSDDEKQCVAPTTQIAAIQLTDGGSTGAIHNTADNINVQGDVLDLIGNYVTSDSYLAIGSDATGATLYLQPSWQGFRRSFSLDISGTYSAPAFDDVFIANRWLRIRTRDQFTFFGKISSASSGTNPPSVTYTPAIPVGTGCVPGLCDGCQVSPITQVRYTLVPSGSPGPPDISAITTNANIEAVSAVLVRHEVDIGTGTPIANTARVLLEHVAHFDVDFVFDTSGAAGLPPALVTQDDAVAAATLAANPQQVRSAIIHLSVYTPSEDERFPFAARTSMDEPLTSFELFNGRTGAARVRSETVEVLLPNITSARMY